MLREWKEPVRPGEEELKMRLAAAREKLAAQQLLIKEQKVPVLVLLERREKDTASARSSRILTRAILRWSPWRERPRRKSASRFYTAILPGFRRRESLYF